MYSIGAYINIIFLSKGKKKFLMNVFDNLPLFKLYTANLRQETQKNIYSLKKQANISIKI